MTTPFPRREGSKQKQLSDILDLESGLLLIFNTFGFLMKMKGGRTIFVPDGIELVTLGWEG